MTIDNIYIYVISQLDDYFAFVPHHHLYNTLQECKKVKIIQNYKGRSLKEYETFIN